MEENAMSMKQVLLAVMFLIPGGKALVNAKETDLPPTQVQQDSRRAWQDRRVQYENSFRDELNNTKAGISELDDKAASLGAQARAKAEKQIKVLRKKADDVENEFLKLETASEADWAALKEKVDRAMDDLEKTYRDAKR